MSNKKIIYLINQYYINENKNTLNKIKKCYKKCYKKCIKYNYIRGFYNYYIMEKYDLAEKYYKMAVDNNDIIAQNDLGYLYYIMKKYDLAEKYLKMAADNNYTHAQYKLGHLYREHIINYDLAEKYYKIAIDNNDISALFSLAQVKNEFFKSYYISLITKNT